jgi:hypothetical protein
VSRRTKHIDIKFHLIKDHLKNGDIDLVWIRTENMIADLLTKAVASGANFIRKRQRLLGYGDWIECGRERGGVLNISTEECARDHSKGGQPGQDVSVDNRFNNKGASSCGSESVPKF